MSSLLLFDGIGSATPGLAEALQRLAQRPENAAFFSMVSRCAEATLTHVGAQLCDELLPDGLPFAEWTRGRPLPPVNAPIATIATGFCAHALQLCALQPGRPAAEAALGAVAALGHSLGLQAAIVAGLGVRRQDEFLSLCAGSMTLMLLCLVRSHQVIGRDLPDAQLVRRYRQQAGQTASSPTPMASIAGVDTDELGETVHEWHECRSPQPAGRSVEVGLINSPRFHVLTGRTSDLLDFYLARHDWLERRRARWTFLPNTAPYHNTLLEPAVRLVEDDYAALAEPIEGERLRFPVYATDSPSDLRESRNVTADFLHLAMVRPVDWASAVRRAVHETSPKRVLDFGPGPGARAFTLDCLRHENRRLPYTSVIRL